MMLRTDCFLFTLLCFVVIVNSCGVTTHNVIARRATKWFISEEYPEYLTIIEKHQDAFQQGAAFPDWGYGCPLKDIYSSLPDASEYAHWPPFQYSVVNYIRSKYPQPWDETTEKLIAFLFGFVSHSVADVLWHDLHQTVARTRQGFIQSMADLNYLGDYGSAHTEADAGGEFMCAYEIDLSFISGTWYLPSEDIAAIYQMIGFYQVTPLILETCNAELYAEVQAISRLPSEFIFPYFSENAPFLVEQFQGWWIGGLNDMATWTTWCWPYVSNWLENGVDKSICYVEVNDTYSLSKLNNYHDFKVASRLRIKEKLQPYTKNIQVDIKKSDRGGAYFTHKLINNDNNNMIINENNDKDDNNIEINKDKYGDSTCITQEGTKDSYTIVTDGAQSLLGNSMAVGDFNNDQLDDLVIGAPSYSLPGQPQIGAVYIIFGRKQVNGHEKLLVGDGHYDDNSTSIIGNISNGRFGYSVGVVDFNMDGYLDLIVSCPGTHAISLKYLGEVYVYFGGPNGIGKDYDIKIVADLDFTNLGETIRHGDVNGDGKPDLLIGNPFAKSIHPKNRTHILENGQVWIYYSTHHRKSGQILTINETDLLLIGENTFNWFGYDMAIIENDNEGQSYLIVTAPQYQFNNSTQPVGKVYCFDLQYVGIASKNGLSANLPLRWTITGVDSLAHFGHSIAVGNPVNNNSYYLAVSSPAKYVTKEHWYNENKPQAGAVYLINIDNLNGHYNLTDLTSMTTFYGDEEYGRLGWTIGFSPQSHRNNDGSQHFWISAPWRNDGYLPSSVDAGSSYFWHGGSNFPTGFTSNSQSVSDLCIQSSLGKSLYGATAQMLDFNGDGFIDIALGGPRDHSIAENAGSVSILFNIV